MAEEKKEYRAESLLEIFLSIRSKLGRVIGRIVQPRDVEDIVQETFLRCYEASSKTTIRKPKAFLVTTARNLAINHIDRSENKLRWRMGSFDESTVPVYMHSAEEGAHNQEKFHAFCDAVRHLPLQCRRAFILKKVYGLSRKEIADYMGITESTVQKHVAKGLALCIEYLERTRMSEGSELSLDADQGQKREQYR